MIESSEIVNIGNLGIKPGKIIAKRNNNLIVTTADPYRALKINNLKVFGPLSSLWSGYL